MFSNLAGKPNQATGYPPLRKTRRIPHPEQRADPWLFISMLLLLALGLLMVVSTTAVTSRELHGESTTYLKRHLLHILLGLCGFAAIFQLNPLRLKKLSGPLLIVGLLLLFAVLVPSIGHVAGGARRWIILGPLRMQPGEMAKLLVVVYFASYLERHHEWLARFQSGVVQPVIVIAVFASLLLMEPDFGSAAVILCVVCCQLLVGGVRLFHLLSLVVFSSAALVLSILSSPYRFKRFETFIDPFSDPANSGYQLIQSLIAVGSGGLTGVGLGAGKQKLFYLPAAHTDFIFAVIAEELGLIGALAVLVLFLIIAYRGLRHAKRLSRNVFLSTLCVGVTLLIVTPALLNIAVVTGLLPTKGLVLPLVGYGGTAMVVNLATMALLLRLSKEP